MVRKYSVLLSALVLMFALISCTSDNGNKENPLSSEVSTVGNKQSGDLLLSDNMNVNPYRIVLNTQSTVNYLKTMWGGTMPSGYWIQSFDISLYVGTTLIADANDFEYCYIDNNYKVTYSRADVVNNSYIKSLAGQTITFTSSGSYTLVNSDNQTINVSFAKYGTAKIVGD